MPDVADEVLARLEATRWQPGSDRERLLPTLGERALPILFRRLETAAVSPGAIPEVASLIGAIVQIGGPAVDAETGQLITQDSPLLQRQR